MKPRKPTRSAAAVPQPYAGRMERLRAEMERRKLDGFLVLDRMDQYWLTGFTGEDGGVIVTDRAVVLLTDGRFDETADIEAPFARKVIRKKRGPETTAREVDRLKIRKLGFEAGHMTVHVFAGLKQKGKAKLQATTGVVSNMRRVKDDAEIAAIRRAIDIAQQAFRKMTGWLKPGMREREVAARLTYEMTKLGAQGPAFVPIVAVGPSGSLPHYEPGEGVVNEREGVLIDWGARAGWYVSDLTRVVWPGSLPAELARVYEIVRGAQQAAIAAIKPGVSASSVDRVARSHIAKAGYGRRFTHSLGHGIGLNVHEGPGLRKGGDDKLEAGMVVTVEPGVYLPGVGGVRIEDDVLVTPDGHEVLSSLPSDLPSMRLK